MSQTKTLYLSRADVEAVDLPMKDVIDAVHLALTEKAMGRTEVPPKHWIPVSDRRFFSAMSSAVPAVKAVACKWQSGSSENAALGLPYLTGLLMLNDIECGLTVAVMDSTWITAQRTAAASAVAARHLAGPDAKVLGIIGCGVQGRTNVEAIRVVCPTIETVRAHDIVPETMARYAEEVAAAHGVEVICCDGAEDVVRNADIVVTAGPIEPDAVRVIENGWLKPGALGITLDYDCYWKPSAMKGADKLLTDDVGQMEHLKEYGYFRDLPPIAAEVGQVAAGLKPGRTTADEVLITVNLGVAVEDVTTAQRIYQAAKAKGLGTWLEL